MKEKLLELDFVDISLKSLAEFTWHGIGLMFFYLITIAFVVYFFSELYAEKFEVSAGKRWLIIFLGMLFGVLNMYLGDTQIYFPVWGLLALFIYYDAKYQELPDAMNGVIAILGLPIAIQSFFTSSSYLEWTALSSLVLFLFFLLILILGPLGGGDLKMMTAIGLYFPLYEVPQIIFFGVTVATVHAICLLIFTKAGLKSMFAFGPGLIVGVLLTTIF